MIEKNFKSLKKDMMKIKGETILNNIVYDYADAVEIVRNELKKKLIDDISDSDDRQTKKEEIHDKAYLRKIKKEKYAEISEIVYTLNLIVRDYETQTSKFIDEMVEEFAGYSILADAFEDESVTDIFIMAWNKIYIEKNGENEKYFKKFRSQKHYRDFLERVLRLANKEMNNGENKIIDFDLYGDRYCATSELVSPLDRSLTIRKHSENHIKLKQVIQGKVMSQEVADLLGTFAIGECNIIYAGITGSGKSTTFRALLDEYVTKANKRLLLCEDTRELFPENDHTLELVTCKNTRKIMEITLDDLIRTALRLKPKYIAIGEVRGVEACSAVEAMETGHSTLFTMHGGKPWNIINRLITKYQTAMPTLGVDVVQRIIGEAVDYIAIQDDIPGIGRKVTSITEVSYDYKINNIDLKTIMRYNFKNNEFEIIGKIAMDKADKMMRRGIRYEDIKDLIECNEVS